MPHTVPRFEVFPGNDADTLRAIARAFGTSEKQFNGDLFSISRQFGALRLKFISDRKAVCTARVVGTRTIPARPAEPEREVEVVEWDCEPILSHDEVGEA